MKTLRLILAVTLVGLLFGCNDKEDCEKVFEPVLTETIPFEFSSDDFQYSKFVGYYVSIPTQYVGISKLEVEENTGGLYENHSYHKSESGTTVVNLIFSEAVNVKGKIFIYKPQEVKVCK